MGSFTDNPLRGRLPLMLLAANAAIWLAAFAIRVLAPAWSQTAMTAASLLLLPQLAMLLLTPAIRAVAGQTFRQCVRTKVAALFIVLLGVCLAALPFLMKGDSTLAGRIKTFLAYGTSVTALLLSVVTIFLGVGVVTEDVRRKQIFSVATKPLARWQYIVGRWLGVVLLDALLLGLAGGAIYGLALYLRGQAAASPDDRRRVETEIFAARRKVSPEPPAIAQAVQARIELLKKEGRFNEILDDYKAQTRGDAAQALELLSQKLWEQESKAINAVAPGHVASWTFKGLDVKGAEKTASGMVRELDREAGAFRIETDRGMLGSLVFGGPVRINGVDGRVRNLADTYFDVQIPQTDLTRGAIVSLDRGKAVQIAADPTIQVSYKASPSQRPSSGLLNSLWRVLNRQTGLQYVEQRNDPVEIPATLTLSARLVDDTGKLQVEYANLQTEPPDRTSVTILPSDLAVLSPVGGFTANYAKALLLMLMQLVFLAAVAVFAGSFLSFPVACILAFPVLVFGLAVDFIAESASAGPVEDGLSAVMWVSHYMVAGLKAFLPDFARTMPGDALVDGTFIAWDFVGETAFFTLGVQTLILVAAACGIFHRRELAKVQV